MLYGSDFVQSLLGTKFIATKSGWVADAADFFVLLCSFLLTTVSTVLVALIVQASFSGEPAGVFTTLPMLQRVISTLSTTVTSAVIIVAGKRYVLFKFGRGGIRSRKVAVYTNPSIGNLAHYLAWNGIELPLLVLAAVWTLALATGLTVNDAWGMVPITQLQIVDLPVGPFDVLAAPGSLLLPASGQLSYVMASFCSGVAGTVGLIEIGEGLQLTSRDPMDPRKSETQPMGLSFYPPSPYFSLNSVFSFSALLNGFDISMELLSSIPSTAQSLTCVDSTGEGYGTGQLWYGEADNQTLSIIATLPFSQSLYRFNASAVILGGTLHSTGNNTKFTPNGTAWPNVMPNNDWAQDIVSLVCNTTSPFAGQCFGNASSLFEFATFINRPPFPLGEANPSTMAGLYWSTALSMAMGAYSSAARPQLSTTRVETPATLNNVLTFTPRYGVYVLVANIVVSIAMLVVVVKLRMASRLGADFLNATRLLLDPLKNPELFNASLDVTVDALANPYMLVKDDNEFLLAEQVPSEELGQSVD